MKTNKELTDARSAKKDEFYTQYADIEKEMIYYKDYFAGKVVYCNCDDRKQSNFWKYFSLNFDVLHLKKLIATCYVENGHPNSSVMWVDERGVHITSKKLKGNGDFASEECIELLRQSDVVVTNPPFSLFKSYMSILTKCGKDFIVLGNMNAITYKEVFPLIRDDKLWYGASIHSGDREFRVPDDYPLNAANSRVDELGNKYIRVKGVRWFTNVEHSERYKDIILTEEYTPERYPKYDKFDAINVNKTQEIPYDYDDIMGVPVSYLDKYNPKQYAIVGEINTGKIDEYNLAEPLLNGKMLFKRLAIKKRK